MELGRALTCTSIDSNAVNMVHAVVSPIAAGAHDERKRLLLVLSLEQSSLEKAEMSHDR
jgi:hypothetical protein